MKKYLRGLQGKLPPVHYNEKEADLDHLPYDILKIPVTMPEPEPVVELPPPRPETPPPRPETPPPVVDMLAGLGGSAPPEPIGNGDDLLAGIGGGGSIAPVE